jgi:hypothetical protein
LQTPINAAPIKMKPAFLTGLVRVQSMSFITDHLLY